MTVPSAETLARHRRILRRFLVVHFLAYLPAFAAAVAAIPPGVERAIDGGLTDADARAVVGVVGLYAGVSFVALLAVAHAIGVPWIRAETERGRSLAIYGAVGLTAAFVAAAAIGWYLLLSR